MMRAGPFIFAAVAGAAVLAAGSANAQQLVQKPQPKFPCGVGFVHNTHPMLHRAGFTLADVTADQVRLTFIGHASFDLRSPQGVRAVTDYNDNYPPRTPPDIATMNINRGNHSSYSVDPGVKHVLRGWDTGTGLPRHDIRLKDVRVYNIPTNISNMGGRVTNDSSIFVFQMGGLCIAHMGHMRHALNAEQLQAMGRIDVVLMPVDRRVTQSIEEILHNLGELKPRVIIPMHFFSMGLAMEFTERVKDRYAVRLLDATSVDVRRDKLPVNTEVWLMRPVAGFFGGGGGFGGGGDF